MSALFRLYAWWLRCRETAHRRAAMSRDIDRLERGVIDAR